MNSTELLLLKSVPHLKALLNVIQDGGEVWRMEAVKHIDALLTVYEEALEDRELEEIEEQSREVGFLWGEV